MPVLSERRGAQRLGDSRPDRTCRRAERFGAGEARIRKDSRPRTGFLRRRQSLSNVTRPPVHVTCWGEIARSNVRILSAGFDSGKVPAVHAKQGMEE